MNIYWTEYASKELKKLPLQLQKQILKKLDFWFSTNFPLHFSRQLVDIQPPQYRFRVNNYRIIGEIEGENFLVLRCCHRSIIYKIK